MINVIHLLDSLNRGGAETLALDVCRNARANDLNVTFVATGGGALEADFAESGVDFVRLQRRLPLDPLIIWRLRQIIKKRNIQIVHAHQAVEGLHAYFAARATNARVALSFHGFVSDQKNRRALRFLIERTEANIAVSRELLRWLAAEERFDVGKNFTIVYNGVDEQRLIPSGKNLRRELDLPADAILIGMIGNFYREPRKDQLTLVRALPAVFERLPNVYCLFAGKIEDGAEHKFADCVRFVKAQNIFDRVKFLGVRADVPDILHALDAFVLSSLHEGLPIAVLEAMLVGAPCVLSDIAPHLEISRRGEFARIFPTGDHEKLAAELLILLGDNTARQNLAVAAQTFARDNFSIAAHLRELKKLYKSII